MTSSRLAFVFALLLPSVAWSQITLTGAGRATPAPAYIGPGDLPGLGSPTAFYSLRGISAAFAATGTGKAVRVRRASDDTQTDVVILPNGNLDVASAAAFAGTAATCSGTIASTTATLTGCSATPAANQPVSGAGITQPAYVVSCGAFVAGAGTCTLNAAQTVSVAETLTFQVALFVVTKYDQTGNGRDITNATQLSQPTLILSCFSGGTRPCGAYDGVASTLYYAGGITLPQPMTYLAVAERTGGFSGTEELIYSASTVLLDFSTANTIRMYAAGGSVPFALASDSVLHTLQAIINGASSSFNVDGTVTPAGSNPGAAGMAGGLNVGSTGSVSFLQGYISEIMILPGALTGAGQSAYHVNASMYWGTP